MLRCDQIVRVNFVITRFNVDDQKLAFMLRVHLIPNLLHVHCLASRFDFLGRIPCIGHEGFLLAFGGNCLKRRFVNPLYGPLIPSPLEGEG